MTNSQGDSRVLLFVGTYTSVEPHLKSASGAGIYAYRLDTQTGQLTRLGKTQGIKNPAFLAIAPDRAHLYACSEVSEWPEGTVTAYRLNADTGELVRLNQVGTRGASTAFVTVEPGNRCVLAANYASGKQIAVLPINADGSLAPASDAKAHRGKGPHPRQNGPHAHCAVPDPTNTYVLAADLGIDQVVIYRMDCANGTLVNHGSGTLPPGSGPRHLVFHPNGRFVFASLELASAVAVFAWDGTSGTLEFLRSHSTLPPATAIDYNDCSDIHIAPDGRTLYVGNRGHDSIAIFGVDASSGQLTYLANQPTRGHIPRNFAIDPTGTFLLAANQDSDSIVIFRINADTGLLDDTGHVAQVPTPVCLKMIQV